MSTAFPRTAPSPHGTTSEAAAALAERNATLTGDALPRVNFVAFAALAAYFVLALIRFQEYTWIDFDLPVIPAVELLMLAAWLMSPKPPGLQQTLPVVLLGIVYFVSSAGVSAEYALEVTRNYILNIALVYIVVAQVATDARRSDALMGVFCLCMAVISVQCILMDLNPEHYGWTGMQAWERMDAYPRFWQVRYVGTLGDPNDLGMTLIASVPMAMFLMLHSRSALAKLVYLACLCLCLYTVYILNSRGTVLGLLAIIAAWGALRFGISRAIVAGIVLLPLFLLLGPSRLNESGLDRSALDRIDSWYNGMKMFAAEPFFGVGKDQYLAHHFKVSHNSWIEIVAELGLIGYLLWNRVVLGALLDAYQMVRGNQLVVSRGRADDALQQRARNSALQAKQRGLAKAPSVPKDTSAQRLMAALPRAEINRAKALLLSIFGTLVAIFFIDRSDSLITFFVCGLIAGTLTRYQHTRRDIDWWPVSFWVYLGAFVALVVVYVSIQVFVL
ncbi:MAG: O-antigen ligase family protein [Pseudomonadota bacterium]